MDGLTVICTGGTTVTLAVAFLLVSATLVAVTVTVCGLLSVAGAVYRPPLEIVPTAGSPTTSLPCSSCPSPPP